MDQTPGSNKKWSHWKKRSCMYAITHVRYILGCWEKRIQLDQNKNKCRNFYTVSECLPKVIRIWSFTLSNFGATQWIVGSTHQVKVTYFKLEMWKANFVFWWNNSRNWNQKMQRQGEVYQVRKASFKIMGFICFHNHQTNAEAGGGWFGHFWKKAIGSSKGCDFLNSWKPPHHVFGEKKVEISPILKKSITFLPKFPTWWRFSMPWLGWREESVDSADGRLHSVSCFPGYWYFHHLHHNHHHHYHHHQHHSQLIQVSFLLAPSGALVVIMVYYI